MKYYTQFLELQDKKLVESIGSDSVFILDGRNNLQTMNIDSMLRMHKLRHVHNYYVGYRIYKGTRFSDNNEIMKEWICSGESTQHL